MATERKSLNRRGRPSPEPAKPWRRILASLLKLETQGVGTLSVTVAVVAGLNPRRDGTFATHLRQLERRGDVKRVGGELRLTAAGRGRLGDPPAKRELTLGAYHALWIAQLSVSQGMLLRVLLAHPEGLKRSELAIVAGRSLGGAFSSDLRALRFSGALSRKGRALVPTEALFPRGLS